MIHVHVERQDYEQVWTKKVSTLTVLALLMMGSMLDISCCLDGTLGAVAAEVDYIDLAFPRECCRCYHPFRHLGPFDWVV
ncbi:hypothetical protein VNO77_22143 [Canavalia gladiata]|uniref:Uncharacterized protein n=1 Tax=Canavalia gladiata TaxID=3824 RepID=A0AAN9L5A6_CANGL